MIGILGNTHRVPFKVHIAYLPIIFSIVSNRKDDRLMGRYDRGCMEKGLTAFGINTTKDSLHILGTCPSVELALKKAIKVGQGPVGAGQKILYLLLGICKVGRWKQSTLPYS